MSHYNTIIKAAKAFDALRFSANPIVALKNIEALVNEALKLDEYYNNNCKDGTDHNHSCIGCNEADLCR